MKRVAIGLQIVLLLLAMGCYEGRNRNPRNQNSGGGGGGGIPGDRAYYFILFEPIFLADEAMLANGCFQGPKSEKTFRMIEWKARVQLMAKGLEQLSEKFVLRPTVIDSSDCRTLRILEDRAVKGDLNKSGWPSSPDEKDRLSIHLKAVFWDRDVYFWGSGNDMQKIDWADVTDLRNQGIDTISLHYGVLSNSNWGRLYYWFSSLPQPSQKLIAGINVPDPGVNGPKAREQQVQTETLEFFEWLRGAANEFAPRSNP